MPWCFKPGLLLAGDRRPGRRPRYWFDPSTARLCLAGSRLQQEAFAARTPRPFTSGAAFWEDLQRTLPKCGRLEPQSCHQAGMQSILQSGSHLRGEVTCSGFPCVSGDGSPFIPGLSPPSQRAGVQVQEPRGSDVPGVSVCPPAAVTSAVWPWAWALQHLLGGKLALCSQWPVVEKSHTQS